MVDTHELGEADLIVTLVAERAGRVRGVAPSARKSRRRFGGALEPLTRVHASWVEREGKDLHRIESLEPTHSYAAMQSEPARQAACAILAEIATATSREEQPDPDAFRLMGAVLDALEAGLPVWTAVRYFELWQLRLHGVLPDLSECESCGKGFEAADDRFVETGEGLRCASCARASARPSVRLAPDDLAFLRAAVKRSPGKMTSFETVSRPGGALEALLKGSLEAFVEKRLRTYRHLAAAERLP